MTVAIQYWHGMIEHMKDAKGQASRPLARDGNAGFVSDGLRLTNRLPSRGQRSSKEVENAKEGRDIHENKIIGQVENLTRLPTLLKRPADTGKSVEQNLQAEDYLKKTGLGKSEVTAEKCNQK